MKEIAEEVYKEGQAVRLEMISELMTDILLYGAHTFEGHTDYKDEVIDPEKVREMQSEIDAYVKGYRGIEK